MDESVKFIIQLVVTPLVTAVVSLALFIFNFNISALKKEIKAEREAREKETKKCIDEFNKSLEHNRDNIGKIFDEIDKLNKETTLVDGRVDVVEAECKLRHKWDGNERRGTPR